VFAYEVSIAEGILNKIVHPTNPEMLMLETKRKYFP
jgi:hypothetical protein